MESDRSPQSTVITKEFTMQLRESLKTVTDRQKAGRICWELYSGLYRLMYRLGPEGAMNANSMGWSEDLADRLLERTRHVAGVKTPEPEFDEGEHHSRFTNKFVGVDHSLAQRINNQEVTLDDLDELNGFNELLVEAYDATISNNVDRDTRTISGELISSTLADSLVRVGAILENKYY